MALVRDQPSPTELNSYILSMDGFQNFNASGICNDETVIIPAGEVIVRLAQRSQGRHTIPTLPDDLKQKVRTASKIFVFIRIERMHPSTSGKMLNFPSKLPNQDPYSVLLYVENRKWIYIDSRMTVKSKVGADKAIKYFQKSFQQELQKKLGIPKEGKSMVHRFQTPPPRLMKGSALYALWLLEHFLHHNYNPDGRALACEDQNVMTAYKNHVANQLRTKHSMPTPDKQSFVDETCGVGAGCVPT